MQKTLNRQAGRIQRVSVNLARRPAKGNSLLERHPQIALEWNYKRNHNLTPEDVTYGSRLHVHWICKNQHEWEASITSRTGIKGANCLQCVLEAKAAPTANDSLNDTHPEIIKYWIQVLNGDVTPSDVRANSNKYFYWSCDKGHEYSETVVAQARKKKIGKCTSECPKD